MPSYDLASFNNFTYRYFVVGSFTTAAGVISTVRGFCIGSRSAVRFCKQLGKLSGGFGFCRAYCSNVGNATDFTTADLPLLLS